MFAKMAAADMPEIPDMTELLKRISHGDKQAEADLLPRIYRELRRMARSCLRGERPDHTLQATALVHEAYLRMIPEGKTDWKSRSHFFGAAAQQMRHILVDHARQRQAAKRGGGARISLDDALLVSPAQCDLLTDLDEALKSLAEFAPRAAKVVELKFFSGMTEEEIAEVLGIHARTVKRDWKMARGWLDDNLSR